MTNWLAPNPFQQNPAFGIADLPPGWGIRTEEGPDLPSWSTYTV